MRPFPFPSYIKALKIVCLFVFLALAAPSTAVGAESVLPSLVESVESGRKDPVELKGYIDAHPYEESADLARLALARVYLDKKEFRKAAEESQRLIEHYPVSRHKLEALYILAYSRYRTGRLIDARSAAEAVASEEGLSDELRAKAKALLSDIKSAGNYANVKGATPAIGVLLPLKGNYARFGEDALSGVLLAAEVFGGKTGSVEVIAKNVGNDSESVLKAIGELKDDPRVMGVVGPLFSSTAVEAANYSQMSRLPVITLTQKEGITGTGEYVFRNFLTPGSQAEALAEYACKTIGHKRFAILYPKSNYGMELARLFETEVKRQGGTVVRQAPYPQGTADFSDEMRRLFGVQVKERKEGRRKIKEFTPILKVDALFIPDSEESVGLIAPYLKYYNITGVQLLGANGWNSKRLVELGGDNIEGAVFVDGFFPGSHREGTEDFTRRFREAYGRTPGVLEAQAYDAASILIAAIRRSMNGDGLERHSVMKTLKEIKDYRGAAGALSFEDSGEARKRLFILTVRDGKIEEAL